MIRGFGECFYIELLDVADVEVGDSVGDQSFGQDDVEDPTCRNVFASEGLGDESPLIRLTNSLTGRSARFAISRNWINTGFEKRI